MDQELGNTAAYVPGNSVCTHQMAALFCMKLHQVEIIMSYKLCQSMRIDVKNNPAKFHPNLI